MSTTDPWASPGSEPVVGSPDDATWDPGIPGLFSRSFRLGEWIAGPVTPLFESWLLTAMEEQLHRVHLDAFGMRGPDPTHVVVNGWYFYSLEFLPVSLGALRRSLPTLVPRMIREPRRAGLWIGPLARHGFPIVEREWRLELAPRYEAATREAETSVEAAGPDALVAMIDRLALLAGEVFASVTVVAGSAYKAEIELARFYRRHVEPRIGGSHLPLLAGLTAPATAPDHAVATLDWWRPTLGELRRPATRRASESPAASGPVGEREAAEAEARRALAGSPRRRRGFERRLHDAQVAARAREAQAPVLTRPWPILRRAVLRIGSGLATAGVIERAEDVFFLTREETLGALRGDRRASLMAAVTYRREARERAARLVPPMSIGQAPYLVRKLVLEGRSFVGARSAGPRTLLLGVPSSPGRVVGRVRVVHDPGDDALAPGEILVAPVTTPAWTPLFTRAAAVVTDVGSALAHASIIAREYGIPAVVGCGDATARLRDGQVVVVDGTAGLVEAPDGDDLAAP